MKDFTKQELKQELLNRGAKKMILDFWKDLQKEKFEPNWWDGSSDVRSIFLWDEYPTFREDVEDIFSMDKETDLDFIVEDEDEVLEALSKLAKEITGKYTIFAIEEGSILFMEEKDIED